MIDMKRWYSSHDDWCLIKIFLIMPITTSVTGQCLWGYLHVGRCHSASRDMREQVTHVEVSRELELIPQEAVLLKGLCLLRMHVVWHNLHTDETWCWIHGSYVQFCNGLFTGKVLFRLLWEAQIQTLPWCFSMHSLQEPYWKEWDICARRHKNLLSKLHLHTCHPSPFQLMAANQNFQLPLRIWWVSNKA